MKCGTVEWPSIHSCVVEVHAEVVKSMVPVLNPRGSMNKLPKQNVFKTQKDILVLFQMLVRFAKASKSKKIEETLNHLQGCAMQVVQSCIIAEK